MTEKTKDLGFIISGGRTGTQLFGDRLASYIGSCHSEHEPDVMVWYKPLKSVCRLKQFSLWHLFIGRALGRTGARVIGQKTLEGKLRKSEVADYILRSRDGYHRNIEEPLIIESNGQWWALASHLAEVYPNAKIALIVRDPRDWVRSWMNKGMRYDRLDLVSLIPPGRLTPRKTGDAQWVETWDNFDSFQRLCWDWTCVNGTLYKAETRSENIRLFRFEDIFATEDSQICELVEHLVTQRQRTYPISSLETLKSTVQNSSQGTATHWRGWSSEQARQMQEICGTLMSSFGYGEEPAWKRLLEAAEVDGQI